MHWLLLRRLYLVESAHFTIRAGLSTGAAATVDDLSAGDHVGELALLRDHHRRTATSQPCLRSATALRWVS